MFGPKVMLIVLIVLSPVSVAASPETITNPTEPPVIETWRLREVWRLDNEVDEELPLMGVITQTVVAADGHYLLLDGQLAQVLEISAEGAFLGTLSRRGQGPGELENPNTLFLNSDGMLGLVQFYPGKIVLVQRDDTPGGNIRAQGENPMFYRARESAGNLVVGGQTMDMSEGSGSAINHRFIRRYSTSGESGATYFHNSTRPSFDPPVSNEKGTWFPSRAWDLALDGSVLLACERDAYRIEWFEPDGRLRRVITRDVAGHVRTKEERQKVLDTMRMFGPQGEVVPKKTILDTEPVIERVQILDDGSIWVKSCYAERGLPEGVHCRFDVHDPEGRLVSEVRIELPVDRDQDYFALLNNGKFLWYRNAASANRARFAQMEAGDEEDEDEDIAAEDLALQVILLEKVE